MGQDHAATAKAPSPNSLGVKDFARRADGTPRVTPAELGQHDENVAALLLGKRNEPLCGALMLPQVLRPQ